MNVYVVEGVGVQVVYDKGFGCVGCLWGGNVGDLRSSVLVGFG